MTQQHLLAAPLPARNQTTSWHNILGSHPLLGIRFMLMQAACNAAGSSGWCCQLNTPTPAAAADTARFVHTIVDHVQEASYASLRGVMSCSKDLIGAAALIVEAIS
jgi:hypothetical protein